jgi:TonB-dependent receptor
MPVTLLAAAVISALHCGNVRAAQPAAGDKAVPQDTQQAASERGKAKDKANQDGTKQDKAVSLSKVTVTGYRYSIEKSLDQKREANAIVEVVTAEDVSKFPDKNVADALQRVPGVIISRDGGEGKNVSVRGLASDLTLTQLNGNYIATAETNGEASRSFNYTLLPANMLSSAELFKTPEARIDEGGIGGTVILHTRRPLDMPSNTGFATVEGTWSDTTHKGDPQVSGMYSWHSQDERFGFLAGLTYQRRTTRSMQATTEDYQWYGDDYTAHPATDVHGQPINQDGIHYWWGQSGFYDQSGRYYTNFFMPTSVDFGIKDEDRKRKGVQLTGQFKPTDNLTLTGNYFRFDLQDNYTLNMLKIPEWNLARYSGDGNWPGGRMLNGLAFDPSGTIVTGAQYQMIPGKTYYCSGDEAAAGGLTNTGGFGPDDCTIPTPQLTGEYHRESALSQTIDLEAELHTDFIDADFKGGRTWADGGPSMELRMSAKPRRNVNGVWEPGNTYSAWDLTGTPSMTFSPGLMQNLQNGIAEVDVGSTDSSWTKNSIWQNYAQADFSKYFDSGLLDSIQFGAKYRDGGAHRNTGNNYWVCQGASPSYDNRFQNCDPNAGTFYPQFLLPQPLTDIPGGFQASVFPAINYPAYVNYLNQTYGGMLTRNEDNFVYNVNEKIASGYFQANFKTDRLRGNIGVRVARTRQHAESTDQVNDYPDYFLDGPDGNPMPCPSAGAPAGYTCQSGFVLLPDSQREIQSFVVTQVDRTYTDVLPSANFAYDLTPDLVLRGAASKVIARPAYTDIAAPGNLSYYSAEYSNDRRVAGGTTTPGWYGSGSNKYLDPYKATQYDLGLEWYFQPGSVVGGDLFRKNVSNFTVPVVRDQNMVINGQSATVQGYSTTAGGRDGTSKGVELYAQHTFDLGLGFQVNYTYNKTNEAAIVLDGQTIGASPLVGSAKNQANVTVFYETKALLLRASYNHRGEVVDGLVNGLNVYEEPYAQLDLNAAYNVTDRLTFTGSVLNATKSEQRAHLGNDTRNRFYSNSYSGRIVYMGLTYKF